MMRMLRALALMLLLLQGGPAAAAEAIDPKALTSVARQVADELMRGIRNVMERHAPPLRLAIRPFRPDEIDLPEFVASSINDAVEAAIVEAGSGSVTLMTRENLHQVWAEASEFGNADFAGLVRKAGADVLVTGRLDPAGNGVQLSYKAIDVRPERTGQTLGMTVEPHLLAVTVEAIGVRPLDQALRNGARELAHRLAAAGALSGGERRFQQTGESSPFGDYALKRFWDELQTQLPEAQRHAAGQQSVTGEAAPAPAPSTLRLAAAAMELDSWVEVDFSVETADGSTIASRTVRILKTSVPTSFLPLEQSAHHGPLRAVGEAVPSDRFDKDAALRAARALARGRVIAQATGGSLAGAPHLATDLAEGAWALQAIAGGVTYDEAWSVSYPDGGKRVRAVLTARAEPLGNGRPEVPTVQARLSAPVIASMQPFSLVLRADRPAAVAVFGWTADDLVLRLYPYGHQRALQLEAGREMTLPGPGESPFMAAPRPGLAADFEALIVIASRTPLDYESLAREAGATVEESIKRAVPIQDFFASLARQGPHDISMQLLPYQVGTGNHFTP
jgi:hypothetical protein